MNDILDALEVIGNNNSDLNHIFINFSPVFSLQPKDVEAALAGSLDRFGRRLCASVSMVQRSTQDFRSRYNRYCWD